MNNVLNEITMTSRHYDNDRLARERFIEEEMGGIGNPIREIIATSKKDYHPEGQIHILTDTGVILICSRDKRFLITKIIANPTNCKRFYENGDAPLDILQLSAKNTRLRREKGI